MKTFNAEAENIQRQMVKPNPVPMMTGHHTDQQEATRKNQKHRNKQRTAQHAVNQTTTWQTVQKNTLLCDFCNKHGHCESVQTQDEWTQSIFLIFVVISPFCGTTVTLCFGLWLTLPMGFKARVDAHLPALSVTCG